LCTAPPWPILKPDQRNYKAASSYCSSPSEEEGGVRLAACLHQVDHLDHAPLRLRRCPAPSPAQGANLICKHARPLSVSARITSVLLPPHPSLPPERERTHTAHPIARFGRKNTPIAALAGCAQVAPECTVRRAATTGRTRRNCAVQPSMPYAATTRFHNNPTVPETVQLHATFTFAAGVWPEQATIIVQHKLIVQNSCNRRLQAG